MPSKQEMVDISKFNIAALI